eukprot:5547343-Prymnesium_polylepis.2
MGPWNERTLTLTRTWQALSYAVSRAERAEPSRSRFASSCDSNQMCTISIDVIDVIDGIDGINNIDEMKLGS